MTKREINNIVIHCSATREGQWLNSETIRRWHKRRGWSDIGYHYVVLLDGSIEVGRPESVPGAHVKGFNKDSIGVCYIGGLDGDLKPKDTRTQEQMEALEWLVQDLMIRHPKANIRGHRDFPGVSKECPCFDVSEWVKDCQFYDS